MSTTSAQDGGASAVPCQTPALNPSSSAAPVFPAQAKQIAQASASMAPPPSIDEILHADGSLDMRVLMIALWKNRKNAKFATELCARPDFKNLRTCFEDVYGPSAATGESDGDDASSTSDGNELLKQAELNFVHSLAAYSIVCYILAIKDRHNGNVLLDIEGHIVHIDFGFFLGRAPGGSFSFETAPFKLTTEMVDVLGGRNSQNFKYFSDLCVQGALAARKHAETIYTLVEAMSLHSKLPCFVAGNPANALAGLRERLFLNVSEEKVAPLIRSMIDQSYGRIGTNKYGQFRVYSNGIAK